MTLRPLAWAALAACGGATHAQQTAAEPATQPGQRVEIVGTTPVPGTGVPRDQIPSNVQTANERGLRQSQAINLPDFMAGKLPSVNVNEVQGNPFLLDVNYRGFTASPLLGTPQGLSVFQDGVRLNEPFGDVVNWDLIPKAALANITLLPGSNPLFGLNTLGGALSLQTKSGDTHPGTELELQAGSFGRTSTELSHGRTLGEHGHLFLAVSTFDEDGWRDTSPSRVRQLFAKAGERRSDLDWQVSLTHGHNRLVGNGPLPEDMLAERRAQVYTRPDITDNEMTLATVNGALRPTAQQEFAFTVYARRSRAGTLNGDLNDDFDPPAVPEAGVENRTHTSQHGEGLALQSTTTFGIHRLALGLTHDRARTRFEQTQAEGNLDASRAVVPTEAPETSALIAGSSRTSSVYFSDVIGLRPDLQATLSGRYNDTRVETVDQGRADLGLDTALDGVGRYRKFNPAVGLTWQALPTLTVFGGWSQGSRAPSPIELGCSDPANACVLPNALQSDPPLDQVVSKTIEAGLRGSLAGDLRWNASLYHTTNQNDLLFISNGRASGYFTNFGRTRRQGIELGLEQRRESLGWSASYSYLQATYQSSACIVAEHNSIAGSSPACPGEGEIAVSPGNRIPGLPAHSVKFNVDFVPADGWRLGAQLNAYSDQFVRGNENNAHRPEGDAFLGSGRVGGFAVLNLTGSWRPVPGWEVIARLANVFDRRYANGGLLGETAFDARGNPLAVADWHQAQFAAPGAPRAGWLGLRWTPEL